jgi:signal transduction histidine kinase
VLTAAAARGLWRTGSGQATVARRRMHTLASASVLLNTAVVVAGVARAQTHSPGPVVTTWIACAAGGLLYLGFAPPRWLRTVWRAGDAPTLRDAELSLMTALSPTDIGAALLPGVTKLFAGKGSVLVDRAGAVLASSGLSEVEAKAAAVVAVAADGQTVLESGMLAVPMRNGWLAVRGSVATPFFGQDEMDLLTGLAVVADLALDRAELFARERAARTELEAFVYSISHDLKSPLVSLLGFVNCLTDETNGSLSADGQFFLSRMAASSRYMQALIHDLLELSRIGRVQTEAADVDLRRVVDEVLADAQAAHPAAVFAVGDLPVVEVNPLRARQLFTNLIDNALAHSGRADVTVAVDAACEAEGVVVSVADDGKGVPADARDRVFGVFERLERQGDAAGTGVGLAVCRKIVEQFGGRIELDDNRPGACFSVHFPAPLVCRVPGPSYAGGCR